MQQKTFLFLSSIFFVGTGSTLALTTLLHGKYGTKDRNADPHHFNADPDPAFHCNAVPDPAFHFSANPDPALHQSDG
jgi:hypothetical protein